MARRLRLWHLWASFCLLGEAQLAWHPSQLPQAEPPSTGPLAVAADVARADGAALDSLDHGRERNLAAAAEARAPSEEPAAAPKGAPGGGEGGTRAAGGGEAAHPAPAPAGPPEAEASKKESSGSGASAEEHGHGGETRGEAASHARPESGEGTTPGEHGRGEGTAGSGEEEASGHEQEEAKEGAEVEPEARPKEHFTPVDIHVAIMLLGAVALVMLLFTLVNAHDSDIRRYAWRVISNVISIFVAVLSFTAVNDWVMFYAGNQSPYFSCALQYGQLVFYVTMLQVVIAYTSGVICEKQHQLTKKAWVYDDALRIDFERPVDDESRVRTKSGVKSVYMTTDGKEVYCQLRELNLILRVRNMKRWATLFKHIAGFASIYAGGEMQHLPIFRQSPLMCVIPVFINQIVIYALMYLFDRCREYEKLQAIHEQRSGLRARLFDEEVQEAEDDISAMGFSFLLVQAVRFKVTGSLPGIVGLPHPDVAQPWHVPVALYGIGVLFGVVAVACALAKSSLQPVHHETIVDEGRFTCDALLGIATAAFGMSFAWCCLWGARCVLRSWSWLDSMHEGATTMMGRILLALILTLAAVLVVFGLDKIDDLFKTPGHKRRRRGAEVVKVVINSLGILVGFSWEFAFDGAVAAIASTSAFPKMEEAVLTVFIFLAIFPAWSKYILTKAMQLQSYADEEAAQGSDEVKPPPSLRTNKDGYQTLNHEVSDGS